MNSILEQAYLVELIGALEADCPELVKKNVCFAYL
jgi:hypothetical protein